MPYPFRGDAGVMAWLQTCEGQASTCVAFKAAQGRLRKAVLKRHTLSLAMRIHLQMYVQRVLGHSLLPPAQRKLMQGCTKMISSVSRP